MSSAPVSSGANFSSRKFSQRTVNVSTVVGGGNSHGRQQHSRWNSKPRSAQKLPLTHFISIPIGHHPGIQTKWAQVTRSLLYASPAIPGLDESVIIKPGSLHITLGVMSLRTNEEGGKKVMKKREPQANANENSSEPAQLPSVQDALALLRTLQEPIRELINDGSNADSVLYLPLDHLDIMRNGRNNESDNAHVLWAGPDLEAELGKRFGRVCELVHTKFKEAGYLQDLRPLKLHCTLINTVYRKPAPQQSSFTLANVMTGVSQAQDSSSPRRPQHRNQRERIPFSYQSILSSAAYRLISVPDATGPATTALGSGPCKIDLGSWPVDEIQICRMGSQDARGVYKSVGGIRLR